MNSGPHDIALKLAFYGNSIPQVKWRGGFIIVITHGRLLAKMEKKKVGLAEKYLAVVSVQGSKPNLITAKINTRSYM